MKKILCLLLFIYMSCLSLNGQTKISRFFVGNQYKIDSVLFYYIPSSSWDNIRLESPKFKLYEDTLFVYTLFIYDDEIFVDVLRQKITNNDTVEIVKEFIRLFITEETENIILKEPDYELYWMNYTEVGIIAYINVIPVYEHQIIMYPEREYNPVFLQMCNLFHNIAYQLTPY